MYDCNTVKSPVTKTIFQCSQNPDTIEVSIGKSDVAYELWIHCDKEPLSVVADSKTLTKLKGKNAYDNAPKGWYYGPGCFYGSDEIETLNIKLGRTLKRRFVQVKK